jgi:hypothetical protein
MGALPSLRPPCDRAIRNFELRIRKANVRPGMRNNKTRSKLRLEIRRRVERITFWFRRSADSPRLVEDSAKELFPFAEIRFANGKCRYIVLTKGVIMTLPWP